MAHEQRAGGLSGEAGWLLVWTWTSWSFSHLSILAVLSAHVPWTALLLFLFMNRTPWIPLCCDLKYRCIFHMWFTLYQFSTWQNIESPWKAISEHVCEGFYRLRSLNFKYQRHHSVGWGTGLQKGNYLCINIHGSVSQLWMQCDLSQAPATYILYTVAWTLDVS